MGIGESDGERAVTGDEGLDRILTDIFENSSVGLKHEDIFHLKDDQGFFIATVYPDRKYVTFHEEYTQTAPQIDELKPLVTFLLDERNGYQCNLD